MDTTSGDFDLPPWLCRQRQVGDIVIHPVFGAGKLVQSWDGFLQVQFSNGLETFQGTDSDTLVPLSDPGVWKWLNRSAADAWLAQAESLRLAALERLRQGLEEDYLATEARRAESIGHGVSEAEYLCEKRKLLRKWCRLRTADVGAKAEMSPDEEQIEAIGATEQNVKVVARAGSGKTSVITDRATFLLTHCRVDPEEVLLVTFNKRAAEEMKERLATKLGDRKQPFVMTFHALAYAFAGGEAELLRNERSIGEETLDREFQEIIDAHLGEPEFFERVRRLMLAHFTADWNRIIEGGYNLPREQMLDLRRTLTSETLRGEFVKSFGEKRIANFLFEHDIPYWYEQIHEWDGRAYRPDFTLRRGSSESRSVVIEYLGLKGDPDYDEQADQKREFWNGRADRWILIELDPRDVVGQLVEFEKCLSARLEVAGIHCVKLSEDEIWERARKRAVDKFSRCASQFVIRCRQSWIGPDALRNILASHTPSCEIEEGFLDLVGPLYVEYLDRLIATGRDDFCGLLQRAVEMIEKGKTGFGRGDRNGDLRSLRFVLVDEYQDFTELFFRLVCSIHKHAPESGLFVVGDDWQSINGFAGADLKYFTGFEHFFAPARQIHITKNYRSEQPIVAAGNALMAGCGGTPAHVNGAAIARSIKAHPVVVVDLATVPKTAARTNNWRVGSAYRCSITHRGQVARTWKARVPSESPRKGRVGFAGRVRAPVARKGTKALAGALKCFDDAQVQREAE